MGMSQTLPERRSTTQPETRWEPLTEIDQVTDRMRRLLEQTFGGFGWASPITERAGWSPLVDLEETDDAYVVEAELPGVKREDVNIELVGNELTITGEAREQERTGTLRKKTRRPGRFDYRLGLPSHVDPEKVDASLSDGILTVRVPKSEKAQRRRIQIK
jgi:HSP20 family protein